MLIKLIDILNELEINNPRITVEKVKQYFIDNIYNNIEFKLGSNGWREYWQICEPYCKKYGIVGLIGLSDFKKLPQQELIKFYNEMHQLVKKKTR